MQDRLTWVERPAKCGDCAYFKRRDDAGMGQCGVYDTRICRDNSIRYDCPLPAWDFPKEVFANAGQK